VTDATSLTILALRGCGEQVELLGCALGEVTAQLRELSQDAANSRMGVLAVVNGVMRILGDGEIEVELNVRCGLAEIEEETLRVHRYLFEQVDKGNRLAGTLGHTHEFAVSRQAHELHEDYVELVAVEPARRVRFILATWPWWSAPQTSIALSNFLTASLSR